MAAAVKAGFMQISIKNKYLSGLSQKSVWRFIGLATWAKLTSGALRALLVNR
jgi:hypothetical protein